MNEQELQILQQLLDMVGSAGLGAFWLIILWMLKDLLIASVIVIPTVSVLKHLIDSLTLHTKLEAIVGKRRDYAGSYDTSGIITAVKELKEKSLR